jgi:phosphate starvation-inducible protein PhoH
LSEIRINQDTDLGPRDVFGTLDTNLKAIEKDCGVEIAVRGDEIIILADPDNALILSIKSMYFAWKLRRVRN